MRSNGIQFDAGNEFDSAPDVEVSSAPAPEPEPKEEAPAPQESELSDNLLQDEEEPAAPSEEKPKATESFVEVKGAGKNAKFNLKPDDPELLKTLQYGLQAKSWLEQRNSARNTLKAKEQEIANLSEKAAVWDELRELAQLGQYEQIVRAVLGDKYSDYEATRQKLENATPDELWEHERKQLEAQRTLERNRLTKELQAEREKAAKQNEAALESRLHSMATREFTRHDFAKFGLNEDLQHQLAEDLWEGAWNMVDKYVQAKGLSPKDITQDMLSKAFERKYARLTSAFSQAGSTQASKILDEKKQIAKQQVSLAASERYPQSGSVDSSLKGWSGSAKDLTKRLLGRR